MTRMELASYALTLHQLMEAQEATGLPKSPWLVAEYTAIWEALREELKDDTRGSTEFSKTERKV